MLQVLFAERIKFITQITKRHADDGDDDVGDGRPPLENLNKEFQAEVINKDVAYRHEKISDNLRPTS